MYDIITFGSAVKDIFLKLNKRNYQILKEKKNFKHSPRSSFCFPLGAKIFIEELKTASGGGATNSAVTFSNQGFKVACFSKIGNDKDGEMIIEELKKFNVSLEFLKKEKIYPTSWALILSFGKEDRTILIQKGACYFMKKNELSFSKLKNTKWFYLAPLGGKSAELFVPLVKFAKKQKINIAANLGINQISLSKKILNSALRQIDILILNKEEAALLTKISQEKEIQIIKKLSFLTKGIIVVTKGKEGSLVFDGKYLFKTKNPSIKVIEKTGAGDAYGSGFLSGFLQKNAIEYAIKLATANALNSIQKVGAKNGLLKKGQKKWWSLIKINKKIL